MKRRSALLACIAAVVAVGTTSMLLLREPPLPAAPPVSHRRSSMGPGPRPAPAPRPIPEAAPAPPVLAPPPPAARPGPEEDEYGPFDPPVPPPRRKDPDEADEPADAWKRYPVGAKGPVVVGVVTRYGDPDPDCWVALERVDDPARPDPSAVETLPEGRFRLTGVPPGKYRVRARPDDGPAAYSAVLDLRDAEVADAGVLRLRRPGCISGVLRDGGGRAIDGTVRLFGRDPATLEARVVETAASAGRQGFQLAPHESGEFRIAASADAGWAVLAAKTDGDGLAWADLRLKPWSEIGAALAAAPPGVLAVGKASIDLDPLEVPDVGLPAMARSQEAPARFTGLLPGKYRLLARWREKAVDGMRDRTATRTVQVGEGETAKFAIDR